MDQELKTFLEGMEQRLQASVVTSEQRLQASVVTSEQRLQASIVEAVTASELRCRAHTEEVETRLLTEFWKWARTADARYRQHQAIVTGLDLRVQTIEDRLSDLEQRKAS